MEGFEASKSITGAFVAKVSGWPSTMANLNLLAEGVFR